MKTSARGGATLVLALLLIALLVPHRGRAGQEHGRDSSQQVLHREIKEDPFMPTDPAAMPTSPAYRFWSPGFFAVQVNLNDSGRNIIGDAANEPSIAVDPLNPSRMAIGWRQFNTISSNFRQAGYGYTTNGGLTWRFPGVIQPGIFRSDPVLDSDAEGTFYYNSLTTSGGQFFCDVFKSSTGGASWDGGTFAQGGDKQWMTIDKTGGMGEGHIYAFWTSYYTACSPGFFTRSTNRGASYESCVTIPENPYWGTLAVGPDGTLYVFGASSGTPGFALARSTVARDSGRTVAWDTATTVDMGGTILGFAGSGSPNPGGLHGQAWVAVDHSNGPSRGNVYALCSVRPRTGTDPLELMFARSTNGGLHWSAPVRVNDDPDSTAWQWFGTMAVAPNGRIDAIWLDTRDNPGSVHSSLFYSFSTDAGLTWSPNARLSGSFNPHLGWPQQNKLGDYFDMVSDDSGAHVAWAATFNGEQDVYYGRISFPLVGVGDDRHRWTPAGFSLSQNYPNPFNPATRIEFTLPHASQVTLAVFNILGEKVATLASGFFAAGRHTVRWDVADRPSGVYFYRVHAGSFVQTRRMILLK